MKTFARSAVWASSGGDGQARAAGGGLADHLKLLLRHISMLTFLDSRRKVASMNVNTGRSGTAWPVIQE
ncbi:hypothetical protein [Streptomyces sp. Y7]|uniref:hypothetical protein n=1 Tax=Streptomyces sp. Y7 TaxID=3342392 RepID=UPI0037211701